MTSDAKCSTHPSILTSPEIETESRSATPPAGNAAIHLACSAGWGKPDTPHMPVTFPPVVDNKLSTKQKKD